MSVGAIDWAFKVQGVFAPHKLVLLALANFANNVNQSWASQSTLAKMTGLTTKTIRKALKDLEADGFISREERRREDGSRATDLITLNIAQLGTHQPENPSGGGEPPSGGVGNDVPGGGERGSPLTTFEPSPEPSEEPNPPVVPPRGERARRLHDDWEPDRQDIERAKAAGLTEQEIERAAIEFRNYWLAKAGSAARKLDWGRTWHNWVLRDSDTRRGRGAGVASRPARPGGGGQGPADFASIVARRRGYG